MVVEGGGEEGYKLMMILYIRYISGILDGNKKKLILFISLS